VRPGVQSILGSRAAVISACVTELSVLGMSGSQRLGLSRIFQSLSFKFDGTGFAGRVAGLFFDAHGAGDPPDTMTAGRPRKIQAAWTRCGKLPRLWASGHKVVDSL